MYQTARGCYLAESGRGPFDTLYAWYCPLAGTRKQSPAFPMTMKSPFVSELEDSVAALMQYYECPTRSRTDARLYGELASECRRLATAAAAGDYRRASVHFGSVRRISMDGLSMEDAWLHPVSRIEKLLRILIVDAHCPYCDGYLRSTTAKQCPECLRDWHDADNVQFLGQTPGQ